MSTNFHSVRVSNTDEDFVSWDCDLICWWCAKSIRCMGESIETTLQFHALHNRHSKYFPRMTETELRSGDGIAARFK